MASSLRRNNEGFDCSSIKAVRELGLKRCKSVLFLSGFAFLKQRAFLFSMRRIIRISLLFLSISTYVQLATLF